LTSETLLSSEVTSLSELTMASSPSRAAS
jgi:hypothetical protein